MTNAYERETVEFQPTTVEVDGVVVTANVQFCITPVGERPVTFVTPTTLSGKIGVMVDGPTLGPGMFTVWAKITSAPETPVLDCGFFRVN